MQNWIVIPHMSMATTPWKQVLVFKLRWECSWTRGGFHKEWKLVWSRVMTSYSYLGQSLKFFSRTSPNSLWNQPLGLIATQSNTIHHETSSQFYHSVCDMTLYFSNYVWFEVKIHFSSLWKRPLVWRRERSETLHWCSHNHFQTSWA